MCKKPWMKAPWAKSKKAASSDNYGLRLAATPFPCGCCLPCRINKSRLWTFRMILEMADHKESAFVTLTYNDDHLPAFSDLEPRHLQLFLKRLRRKIYPKKLRFFACGEYGMKGIRGINPHYHIILFGVSWLQQDLITSCWTDKEKNPIGFCYYGDVNKDTIRYTTGYIMKGATKEYDKKLPRKDSVPEFMRCSLNPGLGANRIRKIAEDFRKNSKFKPRPIKELRYHGKNHPLGRYLSAEMAKALGVSESELFLDFWKYQQELFLEFEAEERYYQSLIEKDDSRRRSVVRRWELYNRKRRSE